MTEIIQWLTIAVLLIAIGFCIHSIIAVCRINKSITEDNKARKKLFEFLSTKGGDK
jgi:uncharacterized membrane protein YjfL (UPF0719 family)